jgi:hypothetical protein
MTLTSSVLNTSGYCNSELSFDLAAISGTSSNGMESDDSIAILISINGGTTFTTQLKVTGSSSAGNVAWYYDGTKTATVVYGTPQTIAPTSSQTGLISNGYGKVKITSLPSSNNLVVRIIAKSNNTNEMWAIDNFMVTGQTLTPSVSVAASSSTVCSGTSVTFTATPINGGTPTYQWYKNGTSISSATSSTYSTSNLINGDTVNVIMSSSLSCASTLNVTSNKVVLTVNPSNTPSVSISVSNSTICSGGLVTYTATPVNGGTAPTYQWKRNENNISGATSATYSTNGSSNNDVFKVVMTSNVTCPTTTTATSNSITQTVNPMITPAVSISASSTNICSGTSVTFTATPTNGGTSPSYQWKKNGNDISGATSATYTSTSLLNNDVITCVLTTSETCVNNTTATSNSINMTVNSYVTSDITTSVSANNFCSGTSVTFTATPVNAGTSPTYRWLKNGSSISGATSLTYTTSSIANGDVIKCTMVSNATCVTNTNDTSIGITMTVRSNTTATISVSNSKNNFCKGDALTYTTNTTNGGTNPTFQWQVNNTNISGANSATFKVDTFTAARSVRCIITPSSDVCPLSSTVTSSSLTIPMLVSPTGVSITASATQVCTGGTINLTGTSTIPTATDTAIRATFETGTTAWTTSGTGVQFAYQNNGYQDPNGSTYNSNDNSKFVLVYARSATGTNNAYIQSPSFSTVNYSSATLNFYQYYNDNSSTSDFGRVQISTNGTSWTTIDSFSSDLGTSTGFVAESATIPAAFLNQSTVYIRFHYYCNGAQRMWAIDNAMISGSKNLIPSYSWSSNTGINATSASVIGYTPANSEYVYFTTTNTYGCSTSDSVYLTINQPSVAGTISGATMLCKGNNAATLTVSGGQGSITKWQQSTNNTIFNDVANSASSSFNVSNINSNSYYRAVFANGVCPEVYSASHNITIGKKTWTGDYDDNFTDVRNWCGGVPDSIESVKIPDVARRPKLSSDITLGDIEMYDTLQIANSRLTLRGQITGTGKLHVDTSSKVYITGNGPMINIPLYHQDIEMNELTIDRPTGASIDKNLRIVSKLQLNNGKLELGDNNLTIDPTAVIGGGNTNSYIKTNGLGKVTKQMSTNETHTFHVGNATYRPVTLTCKDGDVMGVNVEDQVQTSCGSGTVVTTGVVNSTWNIYKANPNVAGVNFVFLWNAADEVSGFDRTMSYVSHCGGGIWNKIEPGSKSATPVNGMYSLTYNNYTGTFSPFAIGSGNGALPVTWVHVSATAEGKSNHILWSTASEKNTERFNIEKSIDGKNFEVVGSVSAKGNSSTLNTYSFVDANPMAGVVYYRVKSVDFDGFTETSKVVSVMNTTTTSVTVYPNPAKDKINIYSAENAEVEITDATGRTIQKLIIKSLQNNEVDLMNLPAGIFFVKTTINGQKDTLKMIKVNP